MESIDSISFYHITPDGWWKINTSLNEYEANIKSCMQLSERIVKSHSLMKLLIQDEGSLQIGGMSDNTEKENILIGTETKLNWWRQLLRYPVNPLNEYYALGAIDKLMIPLKLAGGIALIVIEYLHS